MLEKVHYVKFHWDQTLLDVSHASLRPPLFHGSFLLPLIIKTSVSLLYCTYFYPILDVINFFWNLTKSLKKLMFRVEGNKKFFAPEIIIMLVWRRKKKDFQAKHLQHLHIKAFNFFILSTWRREHPDRRICKKVTTRLVLKVD